MHPYHPIFKRASWLPRSSVSLWSTHPQVLLSPWKSQGFKEAIVTTIGGYDLLTSTTLASTKSHQGMKEGRAMTTYAVVGRPVTRQEGPDKVSGTFLYSADVALPGMVWGKVLKALHAHRQYRRHQSPQSGGSPGRDHRQRHGRHAGGPHGPGCASAG